MNDGVKAALIDYRDANERGDRSALTDAVRRLLAMKAPLGAHWQPVAETMRRRGEYRLALATIDRLAEERGRDAVSSYARANMLYHVGRPGAALAELDRLVELGHGPKDELRRLSFLNFRGSIFLLLGDRDQARAELRRAIELEPRSGQAWLTFTEVADFRAADSNLVALLEAAFVQGPSNPAEATHLAFAVGRMRESLGDHAEAFAAFATGAALFRERASGSSIDLVAQSTSFTAPFIAEVARSIHVDHHRVIFVSGLPRSGTTLVEQILASHPDVAHGDEINLLRHIGQEIGGLDAASLKAWIDRGGDPNRMTELYMRLAAERFGTDGRFVDKSLEAGNHAGLILALFPRAPFFWLRRDPIDNGWSAFRTGFSRGSAWSWNLPDIGERLAQEDLLADYWKGAAGDRIGFVDYAELVTNPGPMIKEIAARAGLELVPQMLEPHQTKRKVATASSSQVRQPINRKGLGVAEPYRQWLGPMIESYDRASAKLRRIN